MVLSLFTGAGLLDSGFTFHKFNVVSAGDILWGNDIKDYFPTEKFFEGIIAGSPCQKFSLANRNRPAKGEIHEGIILIQHFKRIVETLEPHWFLLENVPQVPDLVIQGYHVQRFSLSPYEVGGSTQARNRHFQFGSRNGFVLQFERLPRPAVVSRVATASEGKQQNRRQWKDFVLLQGLPSGYDLPLLPAHLKYRLVGNGVNVDVAKAIAEQIKQTKENIHYPTIYNHKVCGSCGALVNGKKVYCNSTCRGRAFKKKNELSKLANDYEIISN